MAREHGRPFVGRLVGPKATKQLRPLSRQSERDRCAEGVAGGRYQVNRFQGEGGRKRVCLAHDTKLDSDVASK